MLRQVLEFVPYLEIREPKERATLETVRSFPAYTLLKRLVWGMWRRLPAAVQPRPPVTATAWLADRLVSKQIAHCKIFHGCTALCLASLRATKENGAITLVENAACHPRHWKKVEAEECQRFGVHSGDGSGNFAERLLQADGSGVRRVRPDRRSVGRGAAKFCRVRLRGKDGGGANRRGHRLFFAESDESRLLPHFAFAM